MVHSCPATSLPPTPTLPHKGGGRRKNCLAVTTRIAVTIAGSDSSGGAGIQADLKTFSALGVYGASVIAALTAQNTRGVTAIHEVPADFVAAQMDAVFSDLAVGAVKIGMLGNAAVIAAVAAALARHRQTNVVLDPVMVATSGARLLAPRAIAALRSELVPRALVITPNLPEAAALLDGGVATDETEMRRQADRLLALGANSVVMKGGHAEGAQSTDILVTRTSATPFVAPRNSTRNTHGTGCTLSAAIAAGLAKGQALEEAVRNAKEYVTAAIAAADRLTIGSGQGPVHHFHRWW
jgi:hydroxymethylpyrimidine/phosphomethylpyrimidine kinase